ncbi:MAG: hypothetical protein HAW63_01365 [Bdellovibrionaceae bacterium]|nr:hypothetical protein [Pseudobdellovibrionaceae bacterium]
MPHFTKNSMPWFNFAKTAEYVVMSTTVDICMFNFIPKVKERKIKPVHFFLYALSKAQWEIPNFRLRIENGKPKEIDSLICTYPVKNPHIELNHSIINYQHDKGIATFTKEALKSDHIAVNEKAAVSEPLTSNWFLASIAPFLDFTSSCPTVNYHGFCSPLFLASRFTIQGDSLSFKLNSTLNSTLLNHFDLQNLVQKFTDNIADVDKLTNNNGHKKPLKNTIS